MSGLRSSSDRHSEGATNVHADDHNRTADSKEFEPAERFENIPIEDEEGQFDENVRDIMEPVRDIGQLRRYVRPVVICEEAVYLQVSVTQGNDERHVPKMSAEAFIDNNCT